jgi:hypothetical protein
MSAAARDCRLILSAARNAELGGWDPATCRPIDPDGTPRLRGGACARRAASASPSAPPLILAERDDLGGITLRLALGLALDFSLGL